LCQWYIGKRDEEKQRKEQERKADKKEKSMKGKRIDTGLYKGCKGNLELKDGLVSRQSGFTLLYMHTCTFPIIPE